MIKLLYFSGYKWGNMGMRKVRLAYEFARHSEVASLLYVEPAVQTSLLDVVKGRFSPSHLGQNGCAHLKALLGRPRRVEEKVWVYTGSQKTVPLTRLQALRRLRALRRLNQALYVGGIRRLLRRLPGNALVLWLTHPMQAFALDAFSQQVLCCYDWTDDWTQFDLLPIEDAQELVAMNNRVIQEAGVVFAVSDELYHRARAVNPDTYLAPNATDLAVVRQAREEGALAPELRALPRPIIGYIGKIADKMDYELIATLAKARPEWSFVFVGNVWSNHQKQVAALEAFSNVHFLGRRAHCELPAYLRGFDVCVLPHVCNALTRSMDPTKLYDYLASGKPIVSTAVAGVERFADVVYVGHTPEVFLTSMEVALWEDPDVQERRFCYAQENTWQQRGAEVWSTIREHLAT